MAILTETHATPRPNRILSIFNSVIQGVADYRAYRKTVFELSALSDRDLADLGLNRSGIKASAREAVYNETR